MVNNQINQELKAKESRISKQYSMISKFLIFIDLLCVLFFLIISMGIYIWNYPYDWAGFSFTNWIIILTIILSFCLLLNIILYYRFGRFHKNIKEIESKKPAEFINGKKVHTLTFPKGSEGGIFSKTYVPIDSHNLIRIRIQMIKPQELWDKTIKSE